MKLNSMSSFALFNLSLPFSKFNSNGILKTFINKLGNIHSFNANQLVALLLILIAGSFTSTKAQLKPSFSVKADIAIPVMQLSQLNNLGFETGMAIHFGRKRSLTQYSLSINYLFLPGKTIPVDYPNLGLSGVDERQADMNFLTTKLGINFHIPDFERLYGGLEFGIGKYIPGETQTPSYRYGLKAYPSTTTVFTFGKKLGYLIPLGKNHLDLAIRHESLFIYKPIKFLEGSNGVEDLTLASFVGVSATYRFCLAKSEKK